MQLQTKKSVNGTHGTPAPARGRGGLGHGAVDDAYVDAYVAGYRLKQYRHHHECEHQHTGQRRGHGRGAGDRRRTRINAHVLVIQFETARTGKASRDIVGVAHDAIFNLAFWITEEHDQINAHTGPGKHTIINYN